METPKVYKKIILPLGTGSYNPGSTVDIVLRMASPAFKMPRCGSSVVPVRRSDCAAGMARPLTIRHHSAIFATGFGDPLKSVGA